jgi:hypothetical protein
MPAPNKSEDRKSKSERSSKSEDRILRQGQPYAGVLPKAMSCQWRAAVPAAPATRRFGFRPSDFFRFSGFGFRILPHSIPLKETPSVHWPNPAKLVKSSTRFGEQGAWKVRMLFFCAVNIYA